MDLARIRSAMAHVSRAPEVFSCVRQMRNPVSVAAAYLGLGRLPFPAQVNFRDRLTFQLEEYYDLETLWQIYFHNVYPLAPGDRTFIDAGANIGLFSCYAARHHADSRVAAVEPYPPTFERLRQSIEANSMRERITAVNCALSGQPGTATMSAEDIPSQMRSVINSAGIPVQAKTLKQLLDELSLESVDFMKMDIEGSEFDVLLSTPREALRRIRRMSIEYHCPLEKPSWRDLAAYLESAGFARLSSPLPADYGVLHVQRVSDGARA